MIFLLVGVSLSILGTMTLALVRATLGPTVFDRVLALNMFGTKTVLLICVAGFLLGRTDFLDLALLYSLMNFIGTVALLRYTRYGTFADEISLTDDSSAGDSSTGDSSAGDSSAGKSSAGKSSRVTRQPPSD